MAVKVPANKSGFPYGSFIRTDAGVVARVIGKSDRNTTEIEGYNNVQEIGTCYTNGNAFMQAGPAVAITQDEFATEARRYGLDPTRSNVSRLREWDAEQGTWQ